MKKDAEAPNIGLIEKEYPYRYKWSSTILIIIACGSISFLTFRMALSGGGSLLWGLSIFIFVFFLSGLYVAIINLIGKRRLIITKDNIYIPSVWKSESYTLISFSEINQADLIELNGNVTLRLFVKKKEYLIVHSWLPSLDSLNEIIQIVNERIKIHP